MTDEIINFLRNRLRFGLSEVPEPLRTSQKKRELENYLRNNGYTKTEAVRAASEALRKGETIQ